MGNGVELSRSRAQHLNHKHKTTLGTLFVYKHIYFNFINQKIFLFDLFLLTRPVQFSSVQLGLNLTAAQLSSASGLVSIEVDERVRNILWFMIQAWKCLRLRSQVIRKSMRLHTAGRKEGRVRSRWSSKQVIDHINPSHPIPAQIASEL